MITLIVEDGTGLEDSNTYIGLDDARTMAATRGQELPPDDEDAKVALILAMDYLESLRAEYQGKKTFAIQALQWPRTPVEIDGQDFPKDKIPKLLQNAQVSLAVEAGLGTELMPTTDGKEVSKERVEGAVSVEYFESGSTDNQTTFTAAMAFLEPLFTSSLDGVGNGGWMFATRV